MKEVILAKSAGFCFGVKRAVDTVYEQTGKKNVYTFGPIIHNEEVVKEKKLVLGENKTSPKKFKVKYKSLDDTLIVKDK